MIEQLMVEIQRLAEAISFSPCRVLCQPEHSDHIDGPGKDFFIVSVASLDDWTSPGCVMDTVEGALLELRRWCREEAETHRQRLVEALSPPAPPPPPAGSTGT